MMNHPFFERLRTVLLIVLTLLAAALWTSSTQAQPAGPNPLQGLREFLGPTIAVQHRHTEHLLSLPDVVGTAVGLTANGQPAIKVYTRSPALMRVPASLDGIPVEAHFTGEFHALPENQEAKKVKSSAAKENPASTFLRPAPIGVSTGNVGECSAGTISARVKDSAGKNVYALSNNHVYALENAAPLGSSVLQPGRYDTNCSFNANNVIGNLTSLVPIVFSSSANNTVDAAIAASDSSFLGNSTPSNGYGTPRSAIVSAFVGQSVQKYGRTTSLTTGTITGINAIILVGYSSGTARFVNQIVVSSGKPFIKPGDSGSLLVTRPSANPVGLLFAGSGSGTTAIANPIDLVLNAFSVTIDGQP